MDPLAQFEADRYPDWRALVAVPMSERDHVKLYNDMCRLAPADSLLAHAALEAQRPPVSERLTTSELKALTDRNALWALAPPPTPSPVPRLGRGHRNPSLIRRIRADRLNGEKADELASLKEATERMEMHGTRARPRRRRTRNQLHHDRLCTSMASGSKVYHGATNRREPDAVGLCLRCDMHRWWSVSRI